MFEWWIQGLPSFLPPSARIHWTGERNAAQCVQVRSSDSETQSSSRERCQSALSLCVRGHVLISYSKHILQRTKWSEGSLQGRSISSCSSINLKNISSTVSHIFCIRLSQHLIEAAVYNADSELSIHPRYCVFMAAALHHIEIFWMSCT